VQETEYTKSWLARRPAQSVVFPPPDGAERTNRTPVRWKVLFNVGKLFAYPIKLSFGVHDDA